VLAAPRHVHAGASCLSFEVDMLPAVAPGESNVEPAGPLRTREEVLARFKELDEIRERHEANAFDFLAPSAILKHARRLGLAEPKARVLHGMDAELELACDLAVYTAPAGRSRAIDRYARSAAPLDPDEARVLDAMCKARFTVFAVEDRHPAAGLTVTDVVRDERVWLVDDDLETWLEKGMLFAARLYTPESFSMTVGVGVRITAALLYEALASAPQLMGGKYRDRVCEEPRFAEAVYRATIEAQIRTRTLFQDAPAGDHAA
jgi:hypothetical protein